MDSATDTSEKANSDKPSETTTTTTQADTPKLSIDSSLEHTPSPKHVQFSPSVTDSHKASAAMLRSPPPPPATLWGPPPNGSPSACYERSAAQAEPAKDEALVKKSGEQGEDE